MNLQTVFEALKQDQENSAWGIICRELESQGYSVAVNGRPVDSGGFFEGKHADIEGAMHPLTMSLFRDNTLEQVFSVEFTDYHEIAIKPCPDDLE